LKHFGVKTLLGFLRSLIFVKRYSLPVLKFITKPLVVVGAFFVRWVGIPGFRFGFFIRRLLSRLFEPAKHRFLYLVTNRYSIHALMIFIVAGVAFTNFQAHSVRAETFGQKSILYSMVSTDDSQELEVVKAGEVALTSDGSSYDTQVVFDERAFQNLDTTEEVDTGELNEPLPLVPKRDKVETYLVQNGDTLGQISQKFGLSVSTILWSNNLTLRSTIRPGDELTILPEDGILYKIKNGDTISKIAKLYDVDSEKIHSVNNIKSGESLKVGDQILVPGAEPLSTPTQIVRKPVSVKDIFVSPAPRGSSTGKGNWVWPTTWRVITQYYSWKHTGLDIDADYNTFSIASREGIVVYAGWRRGYGLTVEVDHGDGFVTRYAHNSKLMVSVGESVAGGQKIAQSGSTGRSTGTHLHFEVIKNGVRQNPLLYIH